MFLMEMGRLGWMKRYWLVMLCWIPCFKCDDSGDSVSYRVENTTSLDEFLTIYNDEVLEYARANRQATWNYNVQLTDEAKRLSDLAYQNHADYQRRAVLHLRTLNFTRVRREALDPRTRQLNAILMAGPALLDTDSATQSKNIRDAMMRIYATAEVFGRPGRHGNEGFKLNPGLTQVLIESRDYDELLWAWWGWRNATGRQIRPLYQRFVDLENQAAVMAGLSDMGDQWRSTYEVDNFADMVTRVWRRLKPLYVQLHAHVRRKLVKVYGSKHFPATGHIPAHLLGNMWAQGWTGIADLVMPYPDAGHVDITDSLRQQNYTVLKMFQTAEEFFASLGFEPLSDAFWSKSEINQPAPGQSRVCHASAWDMLDGDDFRISMCSVVNADNFRTVHHEMGHVMYYSCYKHQPFTFRGGANPGFHEAVGDVITLSVYSRKHLEKLELLDKSERNETELDLNTLMLTALKNLAFMPFGYLIDQWRWRVFSGEISLETYNTAWWQLRCQEQGVSPPIPRADEDFDPASKYHINSNSPYIRYFVSHVAQFQFHKALCEAAGHVGPLHQCDISGSEAAGKKFKDMLSLGSSQLWQDVMGNFTGSRDIDPAPLIEYFQPLLDWLKNENKGQEIGWSSSNCPGDTQTPSRGIPLVVNMHVTLSMTLTVILWRFFIY